MRGQFEDCFAWALLVNDHDPVFCSIYELKRSQVAGEPLHAVSVIHADNASYGFSMTEGFFIACWKQGAFIINTMHGEIVEENALLDGLMIAKLS